MEPERVKILKAEVFQHYELLVSLSDGTTARFKVEDLLALAPERLDSSSDQAGE